MQDLYNFPLTGGTIVTTSSSVHSFRDCLDIHISKEICDMGWPEVGIEYSCIVLYIQKTETDILNFLLIDKRNLFINALTAGGKLASWYVPVI